MGMDVCGKAPSSPEGEYFRNNVWWWRPLAEYCLKVAPDICAPCTEWHTNSGDGLDADGAYALAKALQDEVDSGRTAAWAVYAAELAALPDERCDLCEGTGKRRPPPERGAGNDPCNGCNATGQHRPFVTHYPFSVENVQEFVVFLRTCGGFEIC